ncbi:MAG TPA: propanediol/glycerol family dehydratase medium subunit [Clostridia bacterium]|nr:propanediol/glycerol family dehydratase medium subunit [Clostridia bacterium]
MDINPKLIEEIVSQVLLKINNSPKEEKADAVSHSQDMILTEVGPAKKGTNPKEVVIGIGAAFSKKMHYTIKRIPHSVVLREVIAGIEEEGCVARVVRITRTTDVGFITNYAAKLAGSGIGIGIQSKGTTVISHKDLDPLTNLELFPLAPLITPDRYRAIGRNAAKYAKGESPIPVEVLLDQTVLPIYQPVAVLLHNRETSDVVIGGPHLEIEYKFAK